MEFLLLATNSLENSAVKEKGEKLKKRNYKNGLRKQ
jgi:hypothetical protein